MSKLKNKVAVVTGGNSGLGLATAKKYVDEGAKVVIFGRNAETLAQAKDALGENVLAVQGDVTNLDDLKRLAQETENAFGHVDILVANAGMGVFAGISDVEEGGYDRQFDINVKGVFFTVQAILPLLKEGASVILVSSAVNSKGAPGGSLYFATKAAVRSFARSMAAELGAQGIRVNSLSPGIVRTSFGESTNVGEEEFDGFVDMVVSQAPLGREGTPQDMANAALFLGSDDSTYVTAADIVVDGGWMNV